MRFSKDCVTGSGRSRGNVNVVAEARCGRDEADTPLVMADIMTIVVTALVVGAAKIGANLLRFERLLDLAVAVAIQIADGRERLSPCGWRGHRDNKDCPTRTARAHRASAPFSLV